jgi:hypothetical protein
MTRGSTRRVLLRTITAAAIVGAAFATLTGCTPNKANEGLSWLSGQDGVASAEMVVDRTTLTGSSGVVRGELVENIEAGRLDSLVQRAVDFARDHTSVELRLGYGGIDFRIDGPATTASRDVWTEVSQLDGLVSALVSSNGVHVRILRDDVRDVLDPLEDLPGAVELEAFRDAAAEEFDRAEDDYGPLQRTAGSLQLLRGADCEPAEYGWSSATVPFGLDAIDAGTVDVCGDYDLVYRPETDLTVVALEWAEQQSVDPNPVPNLRVRELSAGQHTIVVTPADTSLIPVVAAFEAQDAPTVHYTLPGDGSLELLGYDTLPTVLLGLLESSPLAASLTSIVLEGDAPATDGGSVRAIGTLAEIADLIGDAESLLSLDPQFYSVEISADAVNLELYSLPGTTPDMVEAAAALRASPLWTTRDTYVAYLNGYVLIHEGVATIGADYTDRGPYDAFVTAWNEGA